MIGKESCYDYILASHLIEHTTDLIGFLQQCSALLKENGVLSLVIPNKHASFDFFRENTSLAQVLDKHFSREGSAHSKGAKIEYFSSIVMLNQNIAWNGETLRNCRDFEFKFTEDMFRRRIDETDFTDIHECVFTPGSFRIVMEDLRQLGLIDLEEVFFWLDLRKRTCYG